MWSEPATEPQDQEAPVGGGERFALSLLLIVGALFAAILLTDVLRSLGVIGF